MRINGSDLNSYQRRLVLARFVHRNTFEHPYPLSGGRMTTDAAWLEAHSFVFVADGSRLSERCKFACAAEVDETPTRPERHPDEDDGRTYADPRDEADDRLLRD